MEAGSVKRTGELLKKDSGYMQDDFSLQDSNSQQIFSTNIFENLSCSWQQSSHRIPKRQQQQKEKINNEK